MTITFIDPSNPSKPAANYSNLAIIPAGKKLLSISGQIGNDIEGNIAESLEDLISASVKKHQTYRRVARRNKK